MKAVFLDRDATVIYGVPRYERVDSLNKVELLPGALEAMRLLSTLDYSVFFVTNQAGMAEGLINKKDFKKINDKVLKLIKPSGIKILKTYYCPHSFKGDCACRKPKPKMLLDAAKEFDIDLASSYMIGDRPSDVATGVKAGTKTILVMTGYPDAKSAQATNTAANLLEAIRFIENNSR